MEHVFFYLVIVVAVTAVIWLLRKRRALPVVTSDFSESKLRETICDTPDKPLNFGYKVSWLAIRCSVAQDVVESLSIDCLQPANWNSGCIAAYNGLVFVSPSVEGWVFVVSQKLPELGRDSDSAEWTSLLQSLSEKFSDVQYFGTHRVVDYHAWARFKDGREERAFAYLGEAGETLVDRGSRTPGEIQLGYHYFNEQSPQAESDAYWEREDLCYPDEEHVMEVAGKWSVNPNLLEDLDAPVGVGWIGSLRRSFH